MTLTGKLNRSAERPTGLVFGIYVLLAAAVTWETAGLTREYPDDIGQYFQFFQDVATWSHIKGLSFSVAEIFMAVVLIAMLLRIGSHRGLRFDKGSLMRQIGLYMLMVAVGEVVGLATGGDFRISLWEIRPQVYMFVAYMLACNVVTTRKQVDTLIWIVVVGAGLKGIQGVWRYLVDLQGHLHAVESIFPHEQSYFFNAFLTLTPILFLYGGSRRLKRVTLLLLPFVLVASLANQRRAAILALAVGLAGLLLVTLIAHPPRRRTMVVILLALLVAIPPYYAVYAGKGGMLSEPANAITSAFQPDARDASSNLYRVHEDKDLLATMRTSPIIGYGFGKPMLTPYILADISSLDIWWNIMTHDSILWVWMRLGTIGYMLLWLMIGTALVQIGRLVRQLEDAYLRGLAVWLMLMVMQQIIFAYLDLQWCNYRNMIMLGILFALPSRLAAFAAAARPESGASRDDDPVDLRARRFRKPYIPHSLAVVNGRLTTQESAWPRDRRAG